MVGWLFSFVRERIRTFDLVVTQVDAPSVPNSEGSPRLGRRSVDLECVEEEEGALEKGDLLREIDLPPYLSLPKDPVDREIKNNAGVGLLCCPCVGGNPEVDVVEKERQLKSNLAVGLVVKAADFITPPPLPKKRKRGGGNRSSTFLDNGGGPVRSETAAMVWPGPSKSDVPSHYVLFSCILSQPAENQDPNEENVRAGVACVPLSELVRRCPVGWVEGPYRPLGQDFSAALAQLASIFSDNEGGATLGVALASCGNQARPSWTPFTGKPFSSGGNLRPEPRVVFTQDLPAYFCARATPSSKGPLPCLPLVDDFRRVDRRTLVPVVVPAPAPDPL